MTRIGITLCLVCLLAGLLFTVSSDSGEMKMKDKGHCCIAWTAYAASDIKRNEVIARDSILVMEAHPPCIEFGQTSRIRRPLDSDLPFIVELNRIATRDIKRGSKIHLLDDCVANPALPLFKYPAHQPHSPGALPESLPQN